MCLRLLSLSTTSSPTPWTAQELWRNWWNTGKAPIHLANNPTSSKKKA